MVELKEGATAQASRLKSAASSGLARWVALTVFFSVAAIVQTWPLLLHITDRIEDSHSFPFDTYAFIWSLWWVKYAIVDLVTNPFHTDLLFFPQGTDLYLHTLPVVNGLLSIPLQVTTGNLYFSWNVLALLFFVLSGLAMYALALRVTGSSLAALIAGYIFAFTPYILMQFNSRWHISTTWPIPLFALFIIRFGETSSWRNAALAGVLWTILTYNNLEFAMDAGLFLAIFAVYWAFIHLLERHRDRLIGLGRGLAVVAVVWVVLSSPLLLPALLSVNSGDYPMPADDEYYSADLLAFVTPSPLWGPGTEGYGGFHLFPVQEIGSLDGTLFLGFVPLLLAALGVLTFKDRGRQFVFWLLVFLLFWILTLGPYLYIDGDKNLSFLGISSIPLPYKIYDHLPVVGERRVPTRLIVFGILGLSVLAGMGSAVLLSWCKRYSAQLAPLAAVVVMSLVALEYWNPPVHLSELDPPPVFEQIRDEPGDFTVLHAPWGRMTGGGAHGSFLGGTIASYYQSIHHRPTFGGFVSRAKQSDLLWVNQEPVLRYLACPSCAGLPSEDEMRPDFVQAVFSQYRLKYVVVHRNTPHGFHIYETEETLNAVEAYLRDVAGMRSIYEDPDLTVYQNTHLRSN